MSKEIDKNESQKRRTRTFKNFADYWHYAKNLNEEQREKIVKNLSKSEQDILRQSFEIGGWEDLLFRNQCDKVLDIINEKFGVDLLLLRNKVLSGYPQLVQIGFWEYVKSNFDKLQYKHIHYIFGGIAECKHDDEYVLLSKHIPSLEKSDNEEENNNEEFGF